MKILVDNGHGADGFTNGKYSPRLSDGMGINLNDPTIYGGRFREGNFNRIVAKDLVKMLVGAGYDAELVVPEKEDISLGERVRRVNRWCDKLGTKNVIFISIHANAANSTDTWAERADYWTVWTSKGQTKSDTIATFLWTACKKVMPEMRFGTQSYDDGDVDYEEQFYVLRKTACPAVLTENFFYQSKANTAFLASPEGRAKIVLGHYNGIVNYLNSIGQ